MVLLVLLGAVPATLMGYFAFLMALNGMMLFLAEGGWENLLYGAWGSAGLLGVFSIWRIALGYESPLAYFGLIIGVIAACAMANSLDWLGSSSLIELFLNYWMWPVFCSLYLVGELVFRTRKFAKERKLAE